VGDHIVDANKMVELSRALTRAGVDTPVFRAIDGYWYDDDDGRNEVTVERVERELCYAAILWLMGRDIHVCVADDGWIVRCRRNGVFQVWLDDVFDTLIDALLEAVKREVGND